MEPGEALGIAAQLALAMAGFAGVVVAFRSESVHQWQPIDRLRLRLLLTNSVVPLVLSLIAILLLSVKPPPSWIWRACSALAVMLTIPIGAVMTRSGTSADLRRVELARSSRLLLLSF